MLLKSRTAHIRPSFFSEPFLRFTLDFLVLIRKSSEKNWAWWLLQSKTWHFIECRNSPSYRLKDKWTGIKIFQGELQQKGTCRLTFGSAHVMLSMFSKVQIDISLGTTISKPHKENEYFWALPESVPSPKFKQLGPIFECFPRMKSHDYNVIRHIWHWLTIFIPEWQFKCVLRWPAWRNLESKYNVI